MILRRIERDKIARRENELVESEKREREERRRAALRTISKYGAEARAARRRINNGGVPSEIFRPVAREGDYRSAAYSGGWRS